MRRWSVFGVGFLMVFGTTYSALRQNAILPRLWINQWCHDLKGGT